MMKVLVTGGTGFIGSHTVVELLAANYDVTIIDNFSNSGPDIIERIKTISGKNFTFIEGDCNDSVLLNNIFSKNNFNGVIHFAAYKAVGESVIDPLKYYHNNINSTLNVLEACKKYHCPNFVFSSSCTVYGNAEHIPVKESTPRKRAESPYGQTKNICEDILEDIYKAKLPLKLVSLRYFNPIGAHESGLIGELPNGVPSNLVPYITQTAKGIRPQLQVFGSDYDTPDGTNIRDFIHVVDLAKAHVAALKFLKNSTEASLYEVFNVGSGEGVSVLTLINTFEKVNNLKLNYKIVDRRPGDVIKIYGDVSKANKILGWKVEKTLEDALRDAWNWEQKL